MYSGCSRKYLEMTFSPASLAARSSDGNRTSHVAKLRLQSYFAGMSAAFCKPSNVSFLIPASLFVFKSVTTNEIIFACTSCTSSGIGSILFPWKYFSYFCLILL